MKNFLLHALPVMLFLVLAAVFFKPAVFEDKQIKAGDSEKVLGMNKEIKDFQDATGEATTWTGSMFSGMPSYTISNPIGQPNYLFEYGALPMWSLGTTDAGLIFFAMFAMYLFMVAMGYGIIISSFAAIAYAFSSYFIIILPAGHVQKAWAMSYVPLVLMGMMLLFKKKWLLGSIMFAVSLAIELRCNHIQITYYLAILCLFLFVGYCVYMLMHREFKAMWLTIGLLVVGVTLSVFANAERLYSNYEMSQTSIRGPSRLTPQNNSNEKGEVKKGTGLDRDYAFAWSYGGGEMLTLLIPNAYGGGSEELGPNSKSYQAYASVLAANNRSLDTDSIRMPTYWGAQPFTSGPVYLGAIVCFLAVFSFFAADNKYKWWLIGATIFFIFLSMGRNCPAINNFLFDHLPMYNKFRTPAMALVVPQITFAILGCMALKRVADGKYDEKDMLKNLYISFGVVAFICVVIWLVPTSVLDFTYEGDRAASVIPNYPAMFAAIKQDRADLASADALRSLLFVTAAAAALWFVIKKDNRIYINNVFAAICLLTLIDLWGVSRRYCGEDDFVEKTDYVPYIATTADNAILADKDLSYRVMTFNDPFNNTHVSYFHKSIGGYNAAKLRDYQDLIENRISPELNLVAKNYNSIQDSVFTMTPALNMLNMRYLIYDDNSLPIKNKYALGNAWFVKDYKLTKDTTIGTDKYTAADLQMRMLESVNVANTAIVEDQFRGELEGKDLAFDPEAKIQMVSYKPNEVVYTSNSKTNSLAVFSEIYYPKAWSATIDGKPASHFRSDWLLRSMVVPAGEHTIAFKCYPETYWSLRSMSSIISLLLYLALVGIVGFLIYKKYKDGTDILVTEPATDTKTLPVKK